MQQSHNNPLLLTSVAMLAAILMIAYHVAGRATRDALFLTHFDVSQLPMVIMASAVVSVLIVLLLSRPLARLGPARVISTLYFISAFLLAIQWYLADLMPQIVTATLYLHLAALNAILISGFWSVVNEHFDPYAAKAVIPRLTAAAALGGVLGGIAAKSVASAAGIYTILLMLGGMNLVCGAAIAFLGTARCHKPQEDLPTTNPLTPLKHSPLIRRMALLALLVAATEVVLDYILKAEVSNTLSDDDLITFFSYFYMAVGLGTFLVQSTVGNKVLRWLGLGGAMAAWPVAILVTGSAVLLVRSLAMTILMRASTNLMYNSFFRSGFELLYTPIAPALKRTSKVLIDVGAGRFGDFLGALMVGAILLIPIATDSIILIVALVLAMACLTLIFALYRGYVRQLAVNLRDGDLRAEQLEIVDATTAHTVATTQTAIERDKLLHDISLYRSAGGPDPKILADTPMPGSFDALTESIIELRSGDGARIKRILTSHTMTTELLPHVIPLLADERVLHEALGSIRKMASTGAGQLVDALLDPVQPALIKRRLPLILAYSDSPLAIHGLSTGLGDADWNVRFRCAQGLESIRRNHPELKASEERLLHTARREARALAAAGTVLNTSGAGMDEGNRRVQMLFLLFGALYDPETLRLCLRALQSGDRVLQGTALEYLENLLPGRTWALLRPLLGLEHTQPRKKRPLQQAARDLLSAASSLRSKQKSNDVDTPPEDELYLAARDPANKPGNTDTN